MIRYPDNPKLISVEMLGALDRDAPGRWLCQSKYDGYRRVIYKSRGKFTYYAKPAGAGSNVKEMPIELRSDFESLPWPELTLGWDAEWVGPRQGLPPHQHKLYIFDLLVSKEWLGGLTFAQRYAMLEDLMGMGLQSDKVRLVEAWGNPGMVDRFAQQMQEPASEGLVIRRADSTMIGAIDRCADNALWFKCKRKNIEEVAPL